MVELETGRRETDHMEEWQCFRTIGSTTANLVPNWLCLTLILSLRLVSSATLLASETGCSCSVQYSSVKSFNPIMNGRLNKLQCFCCSSPKVVWNSSLSVRLCLATNFTTRDSWWKDNNYTSCPEHFPGHFPFIHSLINPIWLDFYPSRGFWGLIFIDVFHYYYYYY